MENRICQNCKQNFTIEPDDFAFYEKIKVPPPTFCPECRLKRRLTWRNERTLYRRSCDSCSEPILAAYHPNSPYTIFCSKCWWSDKWDPKSFGKDYDFSRPFFEQFNDLLNNVPRIALIETNNANSQYCNYSIGNKNLYYSFASHYNEDSGYLQYSNKMKQSFDCLHVGNSIMTIGSNYCERLYNCAYLTYAFDSSDCVLGYDLHNCTNCIGCVNLRNASYQIFNNQYSKEEYFKLKKELLATNQSFEQAKIVFNDLRKKYPAPESYQKKCIDSLGNDLEETKALSYCFSVKHTEDSKHIYINAINIKNSMDANNLAADPSEFIYESQGISGSSNMKFCDASWSGDSFCTYSNICFSSQNLFGCVGIRGSSYVILNKQYTKEEYEDLVPKIIAHMNKMPFVDNKGIKYSYGEFFPTQISPFAYNESIISQYFPLSKDEALQEGYRWVEKELNNYKVTFTKELYDISSIDTSFSKEVFNCNHEGNCQHQCPKAFRMNEDEINVYKKIGIPIPTLCPSCRHYERLHDRGEYKFFSATCACGGKHDENNIYENLSSHIHSVSKCKKSFETVFTKELHPIIYCRECYKQEVI